MASASYAHPSVWPTMDELTSSPVMTTEDRSFDSSHSRQRRGSSPGKRALQWFTRSRSTSPNNAANANEPSSPNSFVVRNVVKQPGGVSHDQGSNAAVDYYQRMKSQPLASTLGVPPGGPGGGVGYGTANSSNDGRPEEQGLRGRSMSPIRSASPGAMTAGAFRSGRVSPGPQSWSQAREADEQRRRNYSRDRSVPRKPVSPSSPTKTEGSPLSGKLREGRRSPQLNSPLGGSAFAPSMYSSSQGFSMPVRYNPQTGPPPIIPLEGLPSPINNPSSPVRGGATPIGSDSPAESPGQFMDGYESKDSQNTSGLASKWMKGLFNRMPRTEEPEEKIEFDRKEPMPAYWTMRDGPSHSTNVQSSKYTHNSWSDGTPLAGSRSRDEIEAEARKRQSMHMAMRIEDQHKDQVLHIITPSGISNVSGNPRQSPEVDENDMPRSRSPPGRKGVPRFSLEELQGMTQEEREEVASLIDPSGQLSKSDERLTPAQQIIAETRLRQLEKENAEKLHSAEQEKNGQNDSKTPISPQKAITETHIRRDKKEQQHSSFKVVDRTPQADRPTQLSPSAGAISAGKGPMPTEMPLADALQEMMIRFYRFEKYAVPLMRSMEARIIDVERDNQMALQGDGMSANSNRDREMDRWVGQMTRLMKHEIGQLKAATIEIRGGRELLEQFSKNQKQVRNIARVEGHYNHNSTSSSSTFNSAVPRKSTLDVRVVDKACTKEANSSPNSRPKYTNALGQPMMAGRLSQAASPVRDIVPPLIRSTSQQRASKLNERLKALVVEKMRSSSGTTTGESTSNEDTSVQGDGERGNDSSSSENTSFEKVSNDERITADYQVTMARGASEASAKSTSDNEQTASRQMQFNAGFTSPSKVAHQEDTVRLKNGIIFPSSPNRSRSVSPAAMTGNPSNITLPSHATNGLRARAQSYLLSAAETITGNSSIPDSPIPSPTMEMDSPVVIQQIQPLRVNKCISNATNQRSKGEMIASNLPTSKGTGNDGNTTPIRPSIRDRVAFFDAPK